MQLILQWPNKFQNSKEQKTSGSLFIYLKVEMMLEKERKREREKGRERSQEYLEFQSHLQETILNVLDQKAEKRI